MLKSSALLVSAAISAVPVANGCQDIARGRFSEILNVVRLVVHAAIRMGLAVERPAAGMRIAHKEVSVCIIAAVQHTYRAALSASASGYRQVNDRCASRRRNRCNCHARHEHGRQHEGRHNAPPHRTRFVSFHHNPNHSLY